MADNAAVPAPAAENAPNLQLDEATGEMVSKSELKKRQKKREADRKKVAGVTAPPPERGMGMERENRQCAAR